MEKWHGVFEWKILNQLANFIHFIICSFLMCLSPFLFFSYTSNYPFFFWPFLIYSIFCSFILLFQVYGMNMMCGWRFNIKNSWYVYLYCGNWEVPKKFDSWCNYEHDKIFFVVLKLPFLSLFSWALLSVHGGWQKQWSFFVSGNYDKINQTKEEKQCLEYKFNTLTCKVIPQIENKGID